MNGDIQASKYPMGIIDGDILHLFTSLGKTEDQ